MEVSYDAVWVEFGFHFDEKRQMQTVLPATVNAEICNLVANEQLQGYSEACFLLFAVF